MAYEKHEIHIHAQMKRHELMIAFFNCNNVWKSLWDSNEKGSWSIQGFYNPNVSLSLFVEHVYYHTDILSGKIK